MEDFVKINDIPEIQNGAESFSEVKKLIEIFKFNGFTKQFDLVGEFTDVPEIIEYSFEPKKGVIAYFVNHFHSSEETKTIKHVNMNSIKIFSKSKNKVEYIFGFDVSKNIFTISYCSKTKTIVLDEFDEFVGDEQVLELLIKKINDLL